MIDGLCMGQGITRAFYKFDTICKQEKLENQAECIILIGEFSSSCSYPSDNT